MKKDKNEKEEVIISMTTFPAAAPFAAEAIESLLRGSRLPDKIVLYVTLKQFGEKGLPSMLLKLAEENEIFEIRDYPDDIRSYRKLIPALKDFPDALIVTVDDDVIYDSEMLRLLLKYHERFPEHILTHRAKKIIPGKPYKKWKKYRWFHFLVKRFHKDKFTLQTGVGGVLYPSGSLKKEMLNPKLFTELAPTTDDIWFWATAIANDRLVIPVPFGQNKPKGLGKPKEISLKTVNFKTGVDNNSRAFENIMEAFPEVKEKIFDNFAKNR